MDNEKLETLADQVADILQDRGFADQSHMVTIGQAAVLMGAAYLVQRSVRNSIQARKFRKQFRTVK